MTQVIVNLGTGGADLNGRSGSTTGADSNDPKFLPWEGENYVYLPGVVGNNLSVPDEAAFDIAGDLDLRFRINWTSGSQQFLFDNFASGSRYTLAIQSDNKLILYWYSSSVLATAISTADLTTVASSGDDIWIRATLDVDNGAGGADIKFYVSTDGVAWTQLGATLTRGSTTSIDPVSGTAILGAAYNGNSPVVGKYYRAQVFDGIDGTKVLDVDTSLVASGSDTSFTALTGQTVTINRSTSGRKSVAVTHPVWLFGTDDYMEVADNALLDFGASDSFTVLAVVRQWATPVNGRPWISKRNSATDYQGYVLRTNGTALQVSGGIDDGPTAVNDTGTSAFASGNLVAAAVIIDRSSDVLKTAANATVSSGSNISSVGDLSNGVDLRIGREAASGTLYQDFEFIAAAVFRRALKAAEITAIHTFYQNRDS